MAKIKAKRLSLSKTVIGVILILPTLLLWAYYIKPKTEKSTNQSMPISEYREVTYKAPAGWKTSYSNSKSSTFVSPDYQKDPRPSISAGATMSVHSWLKAEKGLKEYILSIRVPYLSPGFKETDMKEALVNNLPAIQIFSSWNDPDIAYYVLEDGYVWSASFGCAPDCRTQEEIENNKYYPVFQEFLKSIKFKN